MIPPHHDPERIKPLIPILRKQINEFLTDFEDLLNEDMQGAEAEARALFVAKEASVVFMPLVIFSINYTKKVEQAVGALAKNN